MFVFTQLNECISVEVNKCTSVRYSFNKVNYIIKTGNALHLKNLDKDKLDILLKDFKEKII